MTVTQQVVVCTPERCEGADCYSNRYNNQLPCGKSALSAGRCIGERLHCQIGSAAESLGVSYQNFTVYRNDPAGIYLPAVDFLFCKVHAPYLHTTFLIRCKPGIDIFMDIFLCILACMDVFTTFSSVFRLKTIFFQYSADLVFRDADTLLFQQFLEHPSSEAAMVFHKGIVDCLTFLHLVFRAAGTVPPRMIVAGAGDL